MSSTYAYARPALTVDAVVLGLDTDALKVLLVRRGEEPFKGKWALPGGFVRVGESPDAAVARELSEETSVQVRRLVQLGAYGEPDRDPREHVVTIAFIALTPVCEHVPAAATDAVEAAWHPTDGLPGLAFDHARIIADAIARLRDEADDWELGRDLLPARFPLRSLQELHERILGRVLDKRNFRRDALASGHIEELNLWESGVNHRAARLFRFTRRRRS